MLLAPINHYIRVSLPIACSIVLKDRRINKVYTLLATAYINNNVISDLTDTPSLHQTIH